jgi:hypothetical protein
MKLIITHWHSPTDSHLVGVTIGTNRQHATCNEVLDSVKNGLQISRPEAGGRDRASWAWTAECRDRRFSRLWLSRSSAIHFLGGHHQRTSAVMSKAVEARPLQKYSARNQPHNLCLARHAGRA